MVICMATVANKTVHSVTQYALDVVYGGTGAQCCKWELLACKRHLADLDRQGDKDFPYLFDATRADRIIRHFANIRRLDVPGQNIVLEDWQQFDDGCIFGWVHKDTGKRRFKTAYRRIARGHAKTTGAAGVGLYAMCGDVMYPPGHPEQAEFELEPEVVVVAVDRTQARIAWGDIHKIGEGSPDIAKRLDIRKTYIRHKTRGGQVITFSKDTKNKDGGRPSLIILEEWHAHPTSEIRDVAVSSKGKKRQCLEYIITTAGTDAENKPCFRDDEFYKKILSGEVSQDDIFVMIREIDDDDDPHNISCWVKANPFFRNGSDYAKTLFEEVSSQHDTAYNSGDPDKIREFLIKRMNRWQADGENKYMSGCMDKWKELAVSREEFAALVRGRSCNIGFDLGKTRDLSAAGAVFDLPDGRIGVCAHGFMPQDRATEHEHGDRVPYKHWAKDRWCTLTPGAVTDNRYIEQWIYDKEATEDWRIAEIDYDGHNALDLAARLEDRFSGRAAVVEIAQTCKGLNEATKEFRNRVLEGKIVHDGSPLLTWCLSNAIEVVNNFGDIKLSKKHKDDTQRIDLIAAILNALARVHYVVDINAHIGSDDWDV